MFVYGVADGRERNNAALIVMTKVLLSSETMSVLVCAGLTVVSFFFWRSACGKKSHVVDPHVLSRFSSKFLLYRIYLLYVRT